MGRGEAEGGDETKVEHPMPPYGLLQAESDDEGDDGEGEPKKKQKKRAQRPNRRQRQGGHQQPGRRRGQHD